MIRFTLCVLLLVATAYGQIGTSTLTGRATDTTGAVVPGVAVTVVQGSTNFTFTATTNNEGLYRVQSLQPGLYRISFEVQGFKRHVRDNVELRTGDTLAVDATLEVGSVAESVEVTAATQLLETETSATGAVVTGKTVYTLPFFQRYVNWSVTLVPGVMTNGNPHPNSPAGWSVAGQRGSTVGLSEDGVPGNALASNAVIKPVLNTVAEVKVLTTTLPAEYGHSGGGVISVVKKTGTNEFHGMVSEFGRSRRMQHRRFFDRARTSDPSPGRPNGVGTYFLLPDATISGPVSIPKLYDGRNKTFFVFGWQRLQEKKIQQISNSAVPTDAMKQGDFSFGGLGNPLYDPLSTTRMENGTWTRQLFPDRRIPLNRFDPVARKILEINPWAAPNQAGTVNANGPVGNHIADEAALVIFDDFSYRIDHQFSPHVKLYGTLTENQQYEPGRPHNIVNRDFDGSAGQITTINQKNFSFGPTWVISPTMVNDARAGYYLRRQNRLTPSFGKNYGQILGIPNISSQLLPGFGEGNRYAADTIYGISGDGPQRTVGETLSFRDDLSIIRGTHAFKMGYEWVRFRLNSTLTNRPSGQFFFNDVTAGLQPDGNPVPRTGNTFAGFLTGSVRRAFFNEELTSWLPRSSVHSFYFQDDWKFSPTLTLNLGVRYSNETPFTTKYGLMTNFDPAATDEITRRPGAIVHPTSPLSRRGNNNFQPRIGAAWHPFKRWVFRGGLAVNTLDVKYPQARIQFEEYVAINNQERAPGDPRPVYQMSRGPDPITFNIRPNGSAAFVGANFSARSADLWDPGMRNPYVLNWHQSIQYEMTANYLLEFSYQGSAGVGLLERWETNTFPIDAGANNPAQRAEIFRVPQNFRPYPHLGSIFMRSNFGHSTFHAGTIKLDKRFSDGLLFSTFYTYGKAIDSQDTDNAGSGVAPIQNRNLEKALAGFNRSHRYVGIMTYELPMGLGKPFLNRGGIWNKLLGGYSIGWVQYLESGNPLTFSFANSPFNYFPTFAGNRRPDVVSTPHLRDNWSDFGGDRF
ncbi:MAG: TonB-dependent receptor domain-containing protein, partial [Bryobacteraceae bacterium]